MSVRHHFFMLGRLNMGVVGPSYAQRFYEQSPTKIQLNCHLFQFFFSKKCNANPQIEVTMKDELILNRYMCIIHRESKNVINTETVFKFTPWYNS